MATKYVQCQELVLQSAIDNVTTTAVFTEAFDLSGVPIVQSDLGDFGYGTIEPNTPREESVKFVITSNPSGTATMTLTRGLRGKAPYGTGGTAFAHSGGSKLVISNTPDFINQLTAKDNAEVVTAQWSFPSPTADSSPATKAYADGLVALGAPEATGSSRGISILSASPNVTIGVATITVATPAVISYTAHGLSIGDSIQLTTTGALPTGLTASTSYFVITAGFGVNSFQVSATLGGAAINTTGTQSGTHTLIKVTPIAVSPNDPRFPTQGEADAMSGGGNFGTPSSTNKFVTELFTNGNSVNIQEFSSNGTWTKPSYGKFALVQLWGAGGGGSGGDRRSSSMEGGRGGGGGAFVEKWFKLSDLTATVSVTRGAGGAGGAMNDNGIAGGNTTFGAYLTAFGGGGGFHTAGSNSSSGAGGGSVSAGESGNYGTTLSKGGAPSFPVSASVLTILDSIDNMGFGGAHGPISGNGGCAYYGGGSGGAQGGVGGSSFFGGAGGGAGGDGSSGYAGGTINSFTPGGGGAGGAIATNGTAGSGFGIGGGGGGGATTGAAGAGGNGGTAAGGGGGGSVDTDTSGSTLGVGGSGGNGFARITVF